MSRLSRRRVITALAGRRHAAAGGAHDDRASRAESCASPRWCRLPGLSLRSISASSKASSPSRDSMSRRRLRPATPSCSSYSTAGSVDIGIGSGPGMAFSAKGAPQRRLPKCMARRATWRSWSAMIRRSKTVADLKGKKLGCTTVGSLTAWIGERINDKEGWGKQRHRRGADRRHAAGARRDQDPSDRRLYRRARDRLQTRGSQGMARHHRRPRHSSIISSRTSSSRATN